MRKLKMVVAVCLLIVFPFGCAAISRDPNKVDTAITVIQGLDRAITWIGPVVCVAASAYNPLAGSACEGMVGAAKALQGITDEAVENYRKNPTPENAQRVLDLRDRMKLTWKKLDDQWHGRTQ
jgi:hypothetical protein